MIDQEKLIQLFNELGIKIEIEYHQNTGLWGKDLPKTAARQLVVWGNLFTFDENGRFLGLVEEVEEATFKSREP